METPEEGKSVGDDGSDDAMEDIDFPEDWMVLDDADDEHAEDESGKSDLAPEDVIADPKDSKADECEDISTVKLKEDPLDSCTEERAHGSSEQAEVLCNKPSSTVSSQQLASKQPTCRKNNTDSGLNSSTTTANSIPSNKDASNRTIASAQISVQTPAKSPTQVKPGSGNTDSLGKSQAPLKATTVQKSTSASQNKPSPQAKPAAQSKSTGAGGPQSKDSRTGLSQTTPKANTGQAKPPAASQSTQPKSVRYTAGKESFDSKPTTKARPPADVKRSDQRNSRTAAETKAGNQSVPKADPSKPSASRKSIDRKNKMINSEATSSAEVKPASTATKLTTPICASTGGKNTQQLAGKSAPKPDSSTSLFEKAKDQKLSQDPVVKLQKLADTKTVDLDQTVKCKTESNMPGASGNNTPSAESSTGKTSGHMNERDAKGTESGTGKTPGRTDKKKIPITELKYETSEKVGEKKYSPADSTYCKTNDCTEKKATGEDSKTSKALVKTREKSLMPLDSKSSAAPNKANKKDSKSYEVPDKPDEKSRQCMDSRISQIGDQKSEKSKTVSDSKNDKTSDKTSGVSSQNVTEVVKKSVDKIIDKSTDKSSSRNDETSSNKTDRRTDRTKSSTDNKSSLRSSKSSARHHDSFRSGSWDKQRSRSHSLERSQEMVSRYGRSDDRSSSRASDKKSSTEARKSDSLSAAKKEAPVSGSGKSTTSSSSKKEDHSPLKKENTAEKKQTTSSNDQNAGVRQPDEQEIRQYEQLLESKDNTIEKGLWRFSVRFSPFEIADLARLDMRSLLNTAQDCVIYLRNMGQNKKKKGESHLYFNRLAMTRNTTQKLFQLQLSSKKINMEINRKVVDSNEKDTAVVELDMTAPGTLSSTAANTMIMSKNAAEDKYVHISNVPKNTPQELLFVVFPTASSIQMPRVGKDKGVAVVQFRSAQCADDVVKCYTSVSVNKMKLKISRKTPSGSKTVETKETAEKTAESLKKQTEWPKKNKDVKKVSEVYQIPVLNKRAVGTHPGTTPKGRSSVPAGPSEAKQPRLDLPPTHLPPPAMPQAFGGFPVPGSVLPPVSSGMMPPVFPGNFSVPPPVHPPAWPVTSSVPTNQVQVPRPHSATRWQTPQQQSFKTDRDLKDTEAISPEWEDDSPGCQGKSKYWDKPLQLRCSPGRGNEGRSVRRSLSPVRPYRRDLHSPGRSDIVLGRGFTRGRQRSMSPARTSSGKRRSRTPVRGRVVRRFSRSPQRSARHSYSPVSQGRLSRSPRRQSPRRQKKYGRSDYSPVSQGSHSPGRRDPSPKRKGRSPARQNQLKRRHSRSPRHNYSPVRQGNRNYSPVSQGRLSRSPERKTRGPTRRDERNHSPSKTKRSPQRRGGSPKHGHKSSATLPHRSRSPSKDGQKEQIQSKMRASEIQERQSEKQRNQSCAGDFSQAATRKSNSPSVGTGRTSKLSVKPNSPERRIIITFKPSPTDNSSQHLQSPERILGRAKSNIERSDEVSVEKRKVTTVTSEPPSSLFSNREALFPAAFSSLSTSGLFPSASAMTIPGLDLLLAATADKSDSDPSTKADRIKSGRTSAEGFSRPGGNVSKRDVYRPRDLSPTPSGPSERRNMLGSKKETVSGSWREDSPLSSAVPDRPLSRDASPYTLRENRNGGGRRANVDHMDHSQDSGQRFVNQDWKTSASRSQNMERDRSSVSSKVYQDQPTASSEYRQPVMNQESHQPVDQEFLLAQRLASEVGENLLEPVKSALHRPAAASAWTGRTLENRLEINQMPSNTSRADYSGFERSNLEHHGSDGPGFDRLGLDHSRLMSRGGRSGLDAPGQPGQDRHGIELSRMDRLGLDRSGQDGPPFSLPRSGQDPPPWQDQPAGARQSWERPSVQDWKHGSVTPRESFDSNLAAPVNPSRMMAAGFETDQDSRGRGPGGAMSSGWGQDPWSAPVSGIGRREEGNWLSAGGGDMQGGMGGMSFGGSGSWLPPPNSLDQQGPAQRSFLPRPPF